MTFTRLESRFTCIFLPQPIHNIPAATGLAIPASLGWFCKESVVATVFRFVTPLCMSPFGVSSGTMCCRWVGAVEVSVHVHSEMVFVTLILRSAGDASRV